MKLSGRIYVVPIRVKMLQGHRIIEQEREVRVWAMTARRAQEAAGMQVYKEGWPYYVLADLIRIDKKFN